MAGGRPQPSSKTMNSSLQKALLVSMLAMGGAISTLGQVAPVNSGGYDWDDHCIDPNSTSSTTSTYTANFGTYLLEDSMFCAGLGISGMDSYYKTCNPSDVAGNIAVNVAGRVGFANGPFGSIQDDFRLANGDSAVNMDNGATFNYAMNTLTDPTLDENEPYTFTYDGGGLCTSGNGWSFADITTAPSTTGTVTQNCFSSGTLVSFIEGTSNRYARVEYLNSNIDGILYVDLIGDAARLTWELTNTATSSNYIGLYFSQWPYIVGGYSGNNYENIADNSTFFYGAPNTQGWVTPNNNYEPYVYVPASVPIREETRLVRSKSPSTFPAYVDITGGLPSGLNGATTSNVPVSPQQAPGMELVLSPTTNVEDANGQSDMTPVDEFVIGDVVNTLAGFGSVTAPKVNDVIVPDVEPGGEVQTFDGETFVGEPSLSYTEKWYPSLVQPGATRTIISYYRSIWGDSNYSSGYAAVVDTPKAFTVNGQAPQNFNYPPNAVTPAGVPYLPIQVNVDNTGPFGVEYDETPMTDVQVTLQLPQGLSDAYNPGNTTLINYISNIQPKAIGTTTFYITADPTVQGSVQYTVTITPTPGVQKQITGFINMGATANLLIAQGANLVTIPYNLNTPTWEKALGLTQNVDFEAFQWDPIAQEYEPSTGPQRGVGTWIVSNANQGNVAIQGNPTTPTDEFPPATGLTNLVTLQTGWNLIANPYNYSFPLGQLIGIPVGTDSVFNYDGLVSGNVIQGSFAYYDPTQQQYDYLGADTDRLIPNYGYWVYATQPVALEFPPIYDLFVRQADQTAPFLQRYNNWRLQLSSHQNRVADANDYAGFTTLTKAASSLKIRKAPSAPYAGAVRSYITEIGQQVGEGTGQKKGDPGQYQTSMHTAFGRQVFNYNVFTSAGGATTVSWPNLAQMPTNLQVMVTDMTARRTINARTESGYSFLGQPSTIRTFQVAITPLGTVRESIGQVNTVVRNVGDTRQMGISFSSSTRGGATITVYQGSKQVGTIISNMSLASGMNSLTWPMILNTGRLAPSGKYTLSIVATGEGGDTTTKLVNFTL
jgi:hypothetical protein